MSPGLVILAVLAQSSTVATSSTATTTPSLGARFGKIGEAPFSVSADHLTALPKAGRYLAEGNVVVRRGQALLHATRVTFDEATGVATAEGEVTAVEGATVISCKSVQMTIPELRGGLVGAELRIKSGFDLGLAERTDVSQWRRQGRDQIIVAADELERKDKRHFTLAGASFTACDCGDDAAPSWRIRTHEASIDLDSGAFLLLPIFEVKNIPVFALPFFYLPLGERRSGLLLPRPTISNPVTGPSIGLPFYLVLGDSADLTLEGRYFSSRGPGAALEARWAPTADSKGELNLATVLDMGRYDVAEEAFVKDPDVVQIPRWSLSLRHGTDFDERSRLRANLNLLGDPAYSGDFAESFLQRQAESSASRIVYTRSSTVGARVSVQFQLLQDLRGTPYAGLEPRRVALFSGDLPGPGAIRYRLVEVRQDALVQPIVSGLPIYGGARFSAQFFTAPRPEVPRFVRADLRPALVVPVPLPFGLVLEPELALRLSGWAGRVEETGSQSASRIAVIGKADLHLELERDFGGVVHRLRPELDYLLIPRVWGKGPGPFFTNDEVDQLGAVHQLRARLDNELLDASTGRRFLGLGLGWGRDLDGPRFTGEGPSELVGQGDVAFGVGILGVTLNGRAAIDTSTRKVTEVLVGGAFDLRRVVVSAAYQRVITQLPRYGFVAAEELVPSATIDRSPYLPAERPDDLTPRQPWSPFEGVTIGAQVRPIDALTLGVTGTFTFGDEERVAQSYPLLYGSADDVPALRNASAQIRYDSPCQCWGAVATVAIARDQPGVPAISFGVDLARLGGAGTAL